MELYGFQLLFQCCTILTFYTKTVFEKPSVFLFFFKLIFDQLGINISFCLYISRKQIICLVNDPAQSVFLWWKILYSIEREKGNFFFQSYRKKNSFNAKENDYGKIYQGKMLILCDKLIIYCVC